MLINDPSLLRLEGSPLPYLSLREKNESPITLSKTKHPAFVISLGIVASNGTVITLIWFPSGYRLIARGYEARLSDKLVPWIDNTFDMSLSLLCFNRTVPQHTHPMECNLSCKSKISTSGQPFSPDASTLGYAFWPHIEARACNVRHPNITALRTSVHREWKANETGLRYQTLQEFQTPSWGYHRFGMAVMLNKMKQ